MANLSLAHQAERIKRGNKPTNCLDPFVLSDFERSHLRDAFVVVKTMQTAAGSGKAALGWPIFLELITTVCAGIAGAGVALLLNIAARRRLPKWVMPVAAGLGMTISNGHTWFERTPDCLP